MPCLNEKEKSTSRQQGKLNAPTIKGRGLGIRFIKSEVGNLLPKKTNFSEGVLMRRALHMNEEKGTWVGVQLAVGGSLKKATETIQIEQKMSRGSERGPRN